MKNILNKFFRKKPQENLPDRITTDTVAEHRQRILADGRRFKYPVQYVKHKLVINAILISLGALLVIVLVGWSALYVSQNSGDFIYSVTKFFPVSVAKVDGQSVLYSDYLMEYRGYVYYYKNKEQISVDSEDGKRQLSYLKRQTIDGAIADAFAEKLAKNVNVSVSDEDLETFLVSQRKLGNTEITEQTYDASTFRYFGWTSNEYRHLLKNRLLRQKVAFAIDDNALNLINDVYSKVEADPGVNFETLTQEIAKIGDSEVSYGKSGWVPANNQDGGLAQQAAKLNKGQNSTVVKSTNGDGYYIVRLIDSTNEQISYEYVKVSLGSFVKSLKELKDQGKIIEYIKIQD